MNPASSPLAEIEGGAVLYPVLRAIFQLEVLEATDAERIEQANAVVMEWLGSKFGISWLSFWNDVNGFRPRDLEYASQYAMSLTAPVGVTAEETVLLQNIGKQSRDEFQVTVTGSKTPEQGSPIGYEFWAEIPEVGAGDRYRAYATLSVSVPLEWPLDDFFSHANTLAQCLRLRWGVAGYSYWDWILYDYAVAAEARYAHAHRYSGFDVGEYVHLGRRWHDEVRTVNWLTWLGPELVDRLKPSTSHASPSLDISSSGSAMLIRAGARPSAGDVNRLEMPREYIDADRMIRPIRAGHDVDFGDPWDEEATTSWLQRFEARQF